jgi:tetratricopeptide (TPR) repeat protein
MSKNPLLLTLMMIVLFAGTLMGAYLLGQNKGGSSSSTASLNKNEKRLRAKPGTEKSNARALTTSRKSNETGRTDEDVKIWGSLEKEEASQPKKVSPTLDQAEAAMENLSTEDSIQKISSIILTQEKSGAVAIHYAMLGYLYGISDSSLGELSIAAFEQSMELAESSFQRIEITFYRTKTLIHQGKPKEALDLIEDLNIASIPRESHYFQLGILAGIALEKLGENEKAQMTYKEIMETIKIHQLNDDPVVDNIYRMAGYKLAQLYRKTGQESSAIALARQMNGDRR